MSGAIDEQGYGQAGLQTSRAMDKWGHRQAGLQTRGARIDRGYDCGYHPRKVGGCPSRVAHGRWVGAPQWAAVPKWVDGSLMVSRVKLPT